tara:strand:+ start:171 stop:347 length:177 start_codon:yes stop_codon:yes gene_type:complete
MDDPKTPVDIAAIAVAGFSWAEFLPNIAALFSIIWLVIRIYETKTFRKLLTRLFTKNG